MYIEISHVFYLHVYMHELENRISKTCFVAVACRLFTVESNIELRKGKNKYKPRPKGLDISQVQQCKHVLSNFGMHM